MLVEDSEQKTGYDRYEGYNKDLIKEISKILGFNYSIRIVENGNYGSYDKKTETWNGMIGELLAQVKKLMLIYTYIIVSNNASKYNEKNIQHVVYIITSML